MIQLKALRRIRYEWTGGDTFISMILILIALAFRLWDLEVKPPHFDEGINGHFVMRMWQEGFYTYDPTNFHGPLYFYFLQLSEVLFGKGIYGFRFITVLMSVGIVWTIARHKRFVGRSAHLAALIIALSPGFVFYGRYAIHESLFIWLQVIFSYGFFSWREERSKKSLALMTIAFFGMFAVKETFFIFFGTWAIALLCLRIEDRLFPTAKNESATAESEETIVSSVPNSDSAKVASNKDIIFYLALGIFATCVLFSGFFMNLKGIPDMFRAFAFWTKTGSGSSGHEKPFLYWIQILATYEWPILFALVLSPLTYFRVGRTQKLLVLVGFGTWLAYSLIPYKTPWLGLNFYWPLAFAAAAALSAISSFSKVNRVSWLKAFAPAILILAIGLSLSTMLRLNFRDYTKPTEPYVYVQTTKQFGVITTLLRQRLTTRPDLLNAKVFVFNQDPWPLPWVLSDYPNLHYGKADDADLSEADVILIDAGAQEVLEGRLQYRYWRLPFQIREAYNPGWAYLRFETFQDVVPTSTDVFLPRSAEVAP